LRSELERPVSAEHALVAGGGALSVLDAGIARLRELRTTGGITERKEKSQELANALQDKVDGWLQQMAISFQERLNQGLDSDARAVVKSARPPSAEARFWRRQVIHAARSVDFFANLQDGVWWSRLHVVALAQ